MFTKLPDYFKNIRFSKKVFIWFLTSIPVILLFAGIIYMNLTPGKFQKDICGCQVRYVASGVLDPEFTEVTPMGILDCRQYSCSYSLLNDLKLMLGRVDFKK